MQFPDDLSVGAIFVGRVAAHWHGKPPSGIVKLAVVGRQWLTETGICGDEQADPAHHGGPEKAVHHYAADHYPFWEREMPDVAARFVPGGVGENVSTRGLTEEMLCIGDVIRIGEAVVQVTQGRQPCWKLSAHVGRADMAARFQKSGRTGWYYRVLREGFIAAGDAIALLERPQPDWPLPAVIAARFDPKLDPGLAQRLAGLGELSGSWRAGFARKSDPTFVEDTGPRLAGG
ncbi:MOSC domain-containing protein [Amaricoccus sp.]|uniref:MOSC domain-containing protein n=1 Tax=Amaricoccus sp. TaxID=1872485 RepID=UPI001B7AA2FE|nr:MOSC domain-containing protein [Amaricoccus sp.]MBP7240403.1 MOSC domain-containing protein [Amaricoccus sp.]